MMTIMVMIGNYWFGVNWPRLWGTRGRQRLVLHSVPLALVFMQREPPLTECSGGCARQGALHQDVTRPLLTV